MNKLPITLCVVADDTAIREQICEYLYGQGYEVQDANYSDAVNRLALWSRMLPGPLAVILAVVDETTDDVVFSSLVGTTKQKNIILLSVSTTKVLDATRWLNLGADDYLADLLEPATLKVRLESLADMWRLQEALFTYISTVSHEMKTPLVSIRGYSEALLRAKDYNLNDETKDRFIDIIRLNAERLLSLIDALRDSVALEHRVMRLYPTIFNIEESIKTVASNLSNQFANKYQTFYIDLAKDLPTVKMDADRFEQILCILLDNANRYTPDNGQITLTAQPMVRQYGPDSALDAEKVHFTVQDTGIGIALEEHQHVFTQWWRSTNHMVHSYLGYGLSLYIAKNIIELAGGRMWFESVLNQGSTFHFTIPVA